MTPGHQKWHGKSILFRATVTQSEN